MQPFVLPEFYTPWPARLNPNLEAARIHSKAWAYEMGLLGVEDETGKPALWDENTFDAHDYALFSAYVHPDASAEELNLLTDWYVWGFFVDDYFLERFKQNHDMAGGKEYLSRLPAFMPIQATETLPDTTNPVERGLTYLWSNTVFTMSENWRLRFYESTKSQFSASLSELANISEDRIANPVEYIEVRRIVGAALWTSDLIEHALCVEIPDEITTTRPMCVLKESYADAVHLHNDIFSYQREIEEEGENSNGVLVLERFLNVSPQIAANLTNDLRTSRLHQFEHTAITEVPLLLDQYKIGAEARLHVQKYINGLQDFQAGTHEWHLRSSRYMNEEVNNSISEPLLAVPTGLGISAANISSLYNTLDFRLKRYSHIPNQPVGQIELPTFYMPFSSQPNPHLKTARQHSKQWAQQIGLFDSLLGLPGVLIWNEHKFDVTDVALCAALAHPSVSIEQLNLTTDWLVWGTYLDDYFPTLYANSKDMVGAKIFFDRLSAFMPIDSTTPMPTNPIENGLNDLWRRTVGNFSSKTQYLFRRCITDMFESWLWELNNHIQNRIPDPIDYLEMRRKTFGCELTMNLYWLTQSEDVPAEIYKTETMRVINNAASDYAGLANDIFSYQKEIEFEGELNNGVLVVQSFLGCNSVQAIEIVNNLMTARMHQFEQIVATELPILFEHFDLDTRARENLLGYIEKLQHWLYGVLQWHLTVDRYTEFELQKERGRSKQSFSTPTGLGTSATRSTELLNIGKTKATRQSTHLENSRINPNGLGTSAARMTDLLKIAEG